MHNDLLLSPRLRETALCPLSSKRSNSPEGLTYEGDITGSHLPSLTEASGLQDRSRYLKERKELSQSIHPSLQKEWKSVMKCCSEAMVQPMQNMIRYASSIICKMSEDSTKLRQEKTHLEELMAIATKTSEQLENKVRKLQQEKSGSTWKKLTQQNNVLTLKNSKLQAEVEDLRRCLASPHPSHANNNKEDNGYLEAGNTQMKMQTLHLENGQLKEQREQLTFVLNNLRLEVSRLNAQQECYKHKVKEQERQIDLLSELTEENIRLNRYRELYFMCREEKETIEATSHFEAVRLRKAQIQVRKLREKLLSLSSLVGRGTFQVMEDEEREALAVIIGNLEKSEDFRRCCLSEIKPSERSDRYQHHYKPAEDTPTPYYEEKRLFLPSIFCLYEQGLKEFETDVKMQFSKPILPQIFLKLRAVLDSYHNKYLIQGFQKYSFVDFTYGFLERFQVDPILKKVITSQGKHQDISYRRRRFLCCLFHPKLQFHSEVLLFREFLLGRHTEDEIYYYLSCRNFIFKGPQLESYSSASDASVFIHYEHLNRCLNMLLNRYSPQVQNMVLHNINIRKKKKAGRYCIESGYVMRALLEVYRAAKQHKLNKLRSIFMRIEESNNQPVMRFAYFRELMEANFRRLSVTELASMYREMVSLYQNHRNFFGCFTAIAAERVFGSTLVEQFQGISHRKLSASGETSTLLTVDPAPFHMLGVESLLSDYQRLLRINTNSVEDCLQKDQLLGKVILLLSNRREFDDEQYQRKRTSLLRELKDGLTIKIQHITKLTHQRQKKQQQLHRAAHILTRNFGRHVRNFYFTFVNKLNERIQRANENAASS